jgi:hypothetical protein
VRCIKKPSQDVGNADLTYIPDVAFICQVKLCINGFNKLQAIDMASILAQYTFPDVLAQADSFL